MAICHPETLRFCTSAMNWGCQHEKTALDEYKRSLVHKQSFPSLELLQMALLNALAVDKEYER